MEKGGHTTESAVSDLHEPVVYGEPIRLIDIQANCGLGMATCERYKVTTNTYTVIKGYFNSVMLFTFKVDNKFARDKENEITGKGRSIVHQYNARWDVELGSGVANGQPKYYHLFFCVTLKTIGMQSTLSTLRLKIPQWEIPTLSISGMTELMPTKAF